jgi:hypothetical protein
MVGGQDPIAAIDDAAEEANALPEEHNSHVE